VCIMSNLLSSEEQELPDLYGCRQLHDCTIYFSFIIQQELLIKLSESLNFSPIMRDC
jgi:hypothetical protein